ncbi:MAG: polysaccharide pyruvyl transferase family protein [Candidatus Hydrogenedentales bacterium]|jgi:colanic acid/amylovoran biosynthesis protein
MSEISKPVLFLGGMCSLPLGTMERQLGNMAILNPMVELLKEILPEARIRTSLQLSEAWCARNGVESLKIRELYEPTLRSGLLAVFDWARSALWRAGRHLGLRADFLIRGRKMEALREADLFLDFSGDTFGFMADARHLLKHTFDLMTVYNLGTPVYMIAQSPGPFPTAYRRFLARRVFRRVALVAAREEVAYQGLREFMDPAFPVIETACTAFLLRPAPATRVNAAINAENFTHFESPLVGLNFTGFNLVKSMAGKGKYREEWPERTLQPMLETARFLLDELKANVVLIPHVYRVNNQWEFIKGPDTKILEQFKRVLDPDGQQYGDRVMLFEGMHEVEMIKGVIGRLDLFISGRLHAGVASLSQAVPTVMIAYGPKHRGFAAHVGQESQVVECLQGRVESEKLIAAIRRAWHDRTRISEEITARLPETQWKAQLNVLLVKALVEARRAHGGTLPPSAVDTLLKSQASFLE